MALFGRRRRGPGQGANPDPAATAAAPMSAVSVSVIRTAPTHGTPAGPAAGAVQGWAGLGVQLPANYAGAYSGTPVSMRGGMVPGLQRRGGTEGLSSSWAVAPATVPTASASLGNSYAANMHTTGPGLQLVNGAPTGGLGPITVRRMKGQITRAQIAQSGAAALQWAQQRPPVAGP